MTEKKKRQELAKSIRRATGLKLPVAGSIARKFNQQWSSSFSSHGIADVFGNLPVRAELVSWCGCGEPGCNEIYEAVAVGPRGEFQLRSSL